MLTNKFNEVEIRIGDTVRVHTQVVEGPKTRVQIFEGIIIRFAGRDVNKTFTVRKISSGGIGVERIWPLDSRSLIKIEVQKRAKNARRAKLYFLRERTGRQATIV
ncbi:50S ribosomal protein L19 [Candidatus Daviesbacteria bacterium RIFCSPLOWO2_02_FULL_40_8]|uniref:50S ribosomal protein L19 n=1 Tax=Candidatus Daviesbacteria bacterium RIFCSPLOWO2_01_FULL_40_24 TaxID=1797787 RepID=A0A1F5MJ31_9BACT|nr:MAG: 50S ribosomal protein L19 [Candidatus Daviesbacteria bacterium RIFCSPHIGHO2_01_FULL_41_45]OGE34451.1 MAG: 50S ribosomal protein L19 [Candidatus Daviesbacteria bacterium RIFCSPHIGHO2_02_FULL_41_14]OGE65363.1 MAG: 50S ribosomal protein L19 [Candidatus Daviesbacteria bacterium RIFCSPLOWO2_01_FULL_40_24]OGE66776.1 MAG: 50S ribosomal protein L19 [Candidatus Daviesbacteria bacterium RIFCSPLOWO2_02_FULL_40_8]